MLRRAITLSFYLACCAVIALQAIAWSLGFESLSEFFTGIHHAAV